ncbi:MAG: type IX secretion system membrane protein PorP/SprF [Bacteroidetes bacterium]|nr:type IX secretion system membrane protein PorP/SprF [Bacteroidota bacterium]
MSSINTYCRILLLLFISATASAQDPFFVHFFNNKSYFNPAMTGYKGAISLDAKYKTQWGTQQVVPYETYGVSLEESVPCAWFDYGLHFYNDKEGDGILTTNEFGASLAGTIVPYTSRTGGTHNVRLGMSFYMGQKRVDFSKLIFSDQLDRKYGLYDNTGALNQTSFVIPNGGESAYYLMPKVGLVYRYAAGKRRNNPPRVFLNSLTFGASLHNALSIFGSSDFGHISSLLNLDTRPSLRSGFFLETEFAMPIGNRKSYVAVSPLFLYQQQNQLDYFEAGAKMTFSRNVGFGAYYHFSSPSGEGNNTSWVNLVLEFGAVLGSREKHRVDFGVAYANNFSGLQNIVGPILEFSFTYHLRKSSFCDLTGRQNELGGGPLCPVSSRGKIYESIW